MRMGLDEFVPRVLDVLDSISCPYFVYGALAVAAWANPRDTQDLELVVQVAEKRLPEILEAFRAAGFRLAPESSTTFAIDGWIRVYLRGRHADLAWGTTPFDISAFARRKTVRMFERDIPLASAEDLVLYKLVAFRYKDLADVESVLVRGRGKLDLGHMRTWAGEIARHTSKFEVPQKLEELLEHFYLR